MNLDKLKIPAVALLLIAFVGVLADNFINGGATVISYIACAPVAVSFVFAAIYSVVNLFTKK